jgi:hypothetical protein
VRYVNRRGGGSVKENEKQECNVRSILNGKSRKFKELVNFMCAAFKVWFPCGCFVHCEYFVTSFKRNPILLYLSSSAILANESGYPFPNART